ncbi:hypothetical protein MUP46_00815 [Patescibacteria group bacterium]|nr:hypothetical protein [Patescibacteria group bacterium]
MTFNEWVRVAMGIGVVGAVLSIVLKWGDFFIYLFLGVIAAGLLIMWLNKKFP